MEDKRETTPSPDGDTGGAREDELVRETRSMSGLVAQYGDSAATAAGAATVYYGIKGAAKLKDLLTQKDEPSQPSEKER